MLNPVGDYPDISVCETLGHQWETLFVCDREFRSCQRCNRQERKINGWWGVNEIKPTIA